MKTVSLTFALAALTGSALAGDAFLVYFGCYTNANTGSKGIYVSKFNSASGELSAPALAAETASPSFLAIHPSRKYLYAVGEMGGPVRSAPSASSCRKASSIRSTRFPRSAPAPATSPSITRRAWR